MGVSIKSYAYKIIFSYGETHTNIGSNPAPFKIDRRFDASLFLFHDKHPKSQKTKKPFKIISPRAINRASLVHIRSIPGKPGPVKTIQQLSEQVMQVKPVLAKFSLKI